MSNIPCESTMKYGREISYGGEVRLIDVVEIPDPLPSWADDAPAWLNKQFPTLSGFFLVEDSNIAGDVKQEDGSYEKPTIAEIADYRVLSKTYFQDYCVSKLGGGASGMARFTEIMEATAGSSSASVRFAYARYEAALSFEYSNTALLTSIMAADDATGHLTSDERDGILAGWPTV